MVLTDGQQKFTTYGFIPVTDLEKLLNLVADQIKRSGVAGKAASQIEVHKITSDRYEISINGQTTLYVQQKGDWAFFAGKSDDLADLPADPTKMLGDLPKTHDLVVRVSMANIPAQYRERALAMIKAGAGRGGRILANVSINTANISINGDNSTVSIGLEPTGAAELRSLVNESEYVTLGLTVDTAARKSIVDLEISPRKGTQLAGWLAQMSPGKTHFAGFLMPDAALVAGMTRTFSDASVAEAKSELTKTRKSVNQILEMMVAFGGESADDIKWGKQIAGEVFDVLEATIKTKKSDCGMSVLLGPDAATFICGFGIANGAKLGHVFKQVVEKVQHAQLHVKVSVETYEQVRLHTFLLPASDVPRELKPLVGETLEYVVGTADDRLLVAVGRDAAKTLKKAIDRSKSRCGRTECRR